MSKVSSYYQSAKEDMEYDLERVENFLKKCSEFGNHRSISANDLNHHDVQLLCFQFWRLDGSLYMFSQMINFCTKLWIVWVMIEVVKPMIGA